MLVLYVLQLLRCWFCCVLQWFAGSITLSCFLCLLCDTDQNVEVFFSFGINLNVKSGIIFASILHPLYIFCSVSQQMFCVCCKTLMSCFQIIAHWLHGQQKNQNISKYNCMYLCLKECLPWVFLHSYWDYFYTIFVLKSCTLHLSLLWFLFFSLLFWSTLYLSGIFIFFFFWMFLYFVSLKCFTRI